VTILGDHPQAAFETGRWQPFQPRRPSAATMGLDRA